MSATNKSVDTKHSFFPYKDILDLPNHKSTKRDHMSIEARAGQFMPFAALTGFDDVVEETARLTDSKRELSDDQKALIDETLTECYRLQESHPLIEVTYFVEDYKKAGGSYEKITENLLSVETEKSKIVLNNGNVILIDNIYDIRIV